LEQPGILVELGLVVVALGILSRVALRLGLPTIPLYLGAGLAFGHGGIVPLVTTEGFIAIGAEIGLVLLLFTLGLRYSAGELIGTLKAQRAAAVVNAALNFSPGFVAGYLLERDLGAALVLGGVTYVSSSGIVAKLLSDLGRVGNRETPAVLGVLVVEDLTLAFFLPLVAAVLAGGAGGASAFVTALGAMVLVGAVLALAVKVEVGISRLVFSHSDEALLLTLLGLAVLLAGLAELVGLSGAVAALLAGIVLSGPAAEGAEALLAPLRDLFAALFFAFIGLSVNPADLVPVAGLALGLAALGAATKIATGWFAAARAGVGIAGRVRAGAVLVARGEFSLAIAGLAVTLGTDPRLEALAVAYVFILALAGPLLALAAEPAGQALAARLGTRGA
jgi:CPA2 family monovalent cation:H+ antiporter-2